MRLRWLSRVFQCCHSKISACSAAKQMLSVRRKLKLVCERYGLDYADLAQHSDVLGLDIQGIERDCQRIHEVSSYSDEVIK